MLENSAPPSILGLAKIGSVEYATHGQWTPTPTSFTYRWLRCDSSGKSIEFIEGASGKTYIPTGADLGLTLRVDEVAHLGSEQLGALSLHSGVIGGSASGVVVIQPEVAEAVLRWPFRMAPDESHIEFIEQDTAAEYEQCVALVLTTRPDEFPDATDFGLADPTFLEGGISESDIAAAVRKWEPRAHLYFTLDELIGFAQEVGIQVNT